MSSTIKAQERITLEGHSSHVFGLAFSPDSIVLASGSYDRTIKLWDVKTGVNLNTLQGPWCFVRGIAFSPDGKVLASGLQDTTVTLWDVTKGEILTTLRGHEGDVYGVAFSPGGTMLASGSFDTTVKLWDITTGQTLLTLQGHTKPIQTVAFSPDGKMLASGSHDTTVKLWDVTTGQTLLTLWGHTQSVFSIALSPNGKVLASGSEDNTIKLWDVLKGQIFITLQGHTKSVHSVAISPDSKVLASVSSDITVRLWDIVTGSCLMVFQNSSAYSYGIAFSPDGMTLAAGSTYTIKLWDTDSNPDESAKQDYAKLTAEEEAPTSAAKEDEASTDAAKEEEARKQADKEAASKLPNGELKPDQDKGTDDAIKLPNGGLKPSQDDDIDDATGSDEFKGKLAIIDGAGGIFGRQVALLLQKQGALLALNDYDSGDSLEKTIQSLPDKSVFSRTTYRTATASEANAWIAELVELHPDGISYIFNCAGILSGLESGSDHYLVKRHLCTLIHVTRATTPHLAANASYVNMSCVGGGWIQSYTPPIGGDTDDVAIRYAIQHGIVNFSKNMALELPERREGVRVNIIATEYAREMEDDGKRVQVANDVAEATMFLFSEKSQEFNGAIVDVDDPPEKAEVELYW